MVRLGLILFVLGSASAQAGQAQIERRLAAIESGRARLSFAARPGVCGNGIHNGSRGDQTDDWEVDCEDQPVRVSLRIQDHRVVAIRTHVGGRWRRGLNTGNDLGTVRPQDAAAYFLRLARSSDVDGDPVLPATLADSVTIWPELLQLARSKDLSEDRRRTAIFWLGQAAGAAIDGVLDSIARDNGTDREIRKQAVFALSQRDTEEAVPALIKIARTSRDPELRKTALFWLGQSEDPRAIDLFEEILR